MSVGVAITIVVAHGLPLLLAIVPGLYALHSERRVLGVALLAGAVAAVIGLPFWQHLGTRAALERGEIRDDIAFLFLPAVYGVAYAVVAGFVLAGFAIAGRILSVKHPVA